MPRLLSPLVLQVGGIAIAGALLIGTVMIVSAAIDRRATTASSRSEAALTAARIEALVEDVARLPLQGDQAGLDASTAIEAHEALREAGIAAEALHTLLGSTATLELLQAVRAARASFDAYALAQAPAELDTLQARLAAVRGLTDTQAPQLAAASQEDHQTLRDAASIAWIVIVLIAALAVGGVMALTIISGRRLDRALRQAQTEKAGLVEVSRAMARRNDQFTALYQIVSEVTETLSLKYVVGTTIREARKLVGAEIVALRLVQNDQLVLVGSEQDVDADAARLRTLPLGKGVVGRAAKRGKTVRIDENAHTMMQQEEMILGIQSGIVVPLIVGARVVGTLGCWSRTPHLFNDDDERILEMMASQVATAIAAANIHEQSERDAHHDPLTSLPNRRQLTEDLNGALLEDVTRKVPMAIAMLDIDHFKRLNDEFGHHVGDVTLQRVAETLRASVRGQDRIYRYGGEEFLVVFGGADIALARTLAERLRAAVERMTLLVDQGESAGPVTVSIGVAAFPRDGQHLEALIDIADRAMYASKEAGRNRVTLTNDPIAGMELLAA